MASLICFATAAGDQLLLLIDSHRRNTVPIKPLDETPNSATSCASSSVISCEMFLKKGPEFGSFCLEALVESKRVAMIWANEIALEALELTTPLKFIIFKIPSLQLIIPKEISLWISNYISEQLSWFFGQTVSFTTGAAALEA